MNYAIVYKMQCEKQEDYEKIEDTKKRSTNIIIHGLQDVTEEDTDVRKRAE